MKILFAVLLFCCSFSSGFAIDCGDMDEKFVKIEGMKLTTNIYNKEVSASKIDKYDYKMLEGDYVGGKWILQNEKDTNLNVSGVSMCIDDDLNVDFKNIVKGEYCWCKVNFVDNYRVSSQWQKVKKYDAYTLNESKPNIEQQKIFVKEQNIQDCMNNCATSCQKNQSGLFRDIDGFYVCGSAIHKLSDARCVIDNKFINAKSILVFDDIAEIQIRDGGNIVFARENENDFYYVGKYNGINAFLRIKNNKIYVGMDRYLMKECYEL